MYIFKFRSENGYELENGMFRSEIGSGFEDPGGTPPPRIPRSTPIPGSKIKVRCVVMVESSDSGVELR